MLLLVLGRPYPAGHEVEISWDTAAWPCACRGGAPGMCGRCGQSGLSKPPPPIGPRLCTGARMMGASACAGS
eukprot:2546190-Amphidinium_carterae.1